MRELIAQNRLLIGTMLSEVYFPNISFILKNTGYDYMIIDCEHGPFDYSQTAGIISMARSNGISAIVRIPEIRREVVIKYLDMGADGFLVPMVKNKEDAVKIVDLAKYQPQGHRGISISRAHSRYAPGNLSEYLAKANAHTSILIQIELRSALEETEEIAALPGVDALMVGPSDLSMDLGIFNRLDHPLLLEAVNRVAEAAKKAGKASGVITSDRRLISNGIIQGMSIICTGSEVRTMTKGFAAEAAAVREL